MFQKQNSCLGLTGPGDYRRFISNYYPVALPLTDLTRKSALNQVHWNEWYNQTERIATLFSNFTES